MAPPLPGPVVPGGRRRRSRTPGARLCAAAAGERAARILLPGGGGAARRGEPFAMVRGDFTTTNLLRWGEGAEVDFGGVCAQVMPERKDYSRLMRGHWLASPRA